MGGKARVFDARNGIPESNRLGDKNYQIPEHASGFFNDGGLIVGSTNHSHMKSGGNAKVIDFYSGLDLTKGPLNPERKTWKQALKDEKLLEETDAVDSLNDWERNVLKEVDPDYQCSSDEEETEE